MSKPLKCYVGPDAHPSVNIVNFCDLPVSEVTPKDCRDYIIQVISKHGVISDIISVRKGKNHQELNRIGRVIREDYFDFLENRPIKFIQCKIKLHPIEEWENNNIEGRWDYESTQ